MTIEHTDIVSVLSSADMADLQLRAAQLQDAMDAVAKAHGAYNWVWTDEIACRGCGARLEIPLLKSTNAVADSALERHRQEQLRVLLIAPQDHE